jgi:CheY-like chemotaxis protein
MQKEDAVQSLPHRKINILVAEDEEYNYLYISEILSLYNVHILRAYDGKMALDLCSSHPELNLVLMDVRMPVMDGYEATRRIKQIRPFLPVIAQTAYALDSDRRQALDEGFDDYITKPVSDSLLLELIEKYAPGKLALKRTGE